MNRIFAIVIASLLAGLLFVSPAAAQESYPMVMSVHPLAVQVGQIAEHEVTARYNLHGTYEIAVTGEGVSGEVIEPEETAGKDKKNDKKEGDKPGPPPSKPTIKVRFKAAAGAMPGVRDVRLATPFGVSTLGQLVVVRDPVVVEQGNNNALEQANEVSLPATVCGKIERAEDVDHFKFSVQAGTSLVFHVISARCQDKIHDLQTHSDPIISLKNSSGTVLAMSDNYFFGDPLLHYEFKDSGNYYLEIRDVRYQGNGYWCYGIEITDRPFVTNVSPMGAAPGSKAGRQLIGFNLPDDPMATVVVADDTEEGRQWIQPRLGDEPTNPAPIIVSRLPQVVEADAPNDSPQTAQEISAPGGISGCIDKPGDIDCYIFDAKKGDRFSLEVNARRHQSALDSNLAIFNDQGRLLAENDDLRDGRLTYADSQLENWPAPADGRYVAQVRDLHLRGGSSFVYFLALTRSKPHFTLEVDTDKTTLAPGNCGAIFVRGYRHNGFEGEIQLGIEGVPSGVRASCGRILAGATDGCIILQADDDAPQQMANVRITGKAILVADQKIEVPVPSAVASPLQETYLPGGGRGHFPVEMHTVSVAPALHIKRLKISPTEIVLKPGGSQKIDVVLQRVEGFGENVTLDLLFRHLGSVYGNTLPKGVTMDEKASKILLTGKQLEGHIMLKAADDAEPIERQQIAVMANVSVNFVIKMTYCGEPCFVTVVRP